MKRNSDSRIGETKTGAEDHAISDKLMQEEGWSQDSHGRILKGNGRPIFKVGFVSAIRKIVE